MIEGFKFGVPPIVTPDTASPAIFESIESTEGQPARSPRRTRYPLRLSAIPRLPRETSEPSMEISANFAFLNAEIPACGGECEFRGAACLRRPTGVLLPCPARTGVPAQACLQGREGSEATEGHELWTVTSATPPSANSCPRSCGRRPNTSGQAGQRGGPRQQVAGTGEGAGCRARAVSRPLLDGPHLPTQGRGESAGQDLRRIPRPERGTGNHPSQRPGTGGPAGPAGCGGGGPQGDRERTGSVA